MSREETAWGHRVHGLTVDLHLIAQQAKQDIERLESARTFIAFLEKVEIEESSRRGLLTLRLPSGESEPIRTEQKDTDRGQAMIQRARSLEGRWVLVYRYNERKTGSGTSRSGCWRTLWTSVPTEPYPAQRPRRWCWRRRAGTWRGRSRRGQSRACRGAALSVDQLEQARVAAREAG